MGLGADPGPFSQVCHRLQHLQAGPLGPLFDGENGEL
jgi:hypothetical protein